MSWYEKLPSHCPPTDAEQPHGKTFYRLCKEDPVSTSDFCSQRYLNPYKKFAGISECTLRSVSLWDTKEKCLEQRKFPTHKNKKIGQLILNDEDGLVLNTFKPNHYSWWRAESFNPTQTLIIE